MRTPVLNIPHSATRAALGNMAPNHQDHEEAETNLVLHDFQPLLFDMAALGLGMGTSSKRLLAWRAVVWGLLITYVVLWTLEHSSSRFVVNIQTINDFISLLAAIAVQVQFVKYSEGLGAVVRELGPRRLQGPLRAVILLVAFVPWVAQSAMTATYLLRPGSQGVPEALLRYVLVKNHIWFGAALTTCLSMGVSARLLHLNAALFLEGPLSPRAVDGARQAHGLLCSMVSVMDNALGPVVFFWHMVFAIDMMSVSQEVTQRSIVPTTMLALNIVLLLLLWTFSCEACARLRINALNTVDTLAYKLSEQPELSLPGSLACAAARQQDVEITCWGIVPMRRSLSVAIAAGTALSIGAMFYQGD